MVLLWRTYNSVCGFEGGMKRSCPYPSVDEIRKDNAGQSGRAFHGRKSLLHVFSFYYCKIQSGCLLLSPESQSSEHTPPHTHTAVGHGTLLLLVLGGEARQAPGAYWLVTLSYLSSMPGRDFI